MTDCGPLFSQITALQTRITSDKASLADPNICKGLSKEVCQKLIKEIEDDIHLATFQLNDVQVQVTPICNLLIGTWQFNANGSDGQLIIDHVDSVTGNSLLGTVQLTDQSAPDAIEGSWDDTAKVITFGVTTFGRDSDKQVFQSYTGFLGDDHADQFVILAGSFTQSDTQPGSGRFQFGWFARKP